MSRISKAMAVLMLAGSSVFLLSTSAAGQSRSAGSKEGSAFRTADGQPDFQGVWTNATRVPLERPEKLGAKEVYTEQEAAENEKLGARGDRPVKCAPTSSPTTNCYPAVEYDVSQYGLDTGQEKMASSLRTSLLVGPDGRIPPMTPEGSKRRAERAARTKGHEFDGPENRPLAERCILGPEVGPPMLPVGYNSNIQIVQGPEHVAILQEMIHDFRIVPLDQSPHISPNIRQWRGDPRGHWEGDTLVVDTTNFMERTAVRFRGASENLHVIERFTRTDADTILYEFTIEDPSTWVRPWSGKITLTKIDNPIYEYACQEGNYGMPNILSGARSVEETAAKAAAK